MGQTRDYDRYRGPLPITQGAYEAFVQSFGDVEEEPRLGVIYRMSLDDIIDCDGIDGMNDYLDAITGVILTDVEYSVHGQVNNDEITVLATGVVDRADWI